MVNYHLTFKVILPPCAVTLTDFVYLLHVQIRKKDKKVNLFPDKKQEEQKDKCWGVYFGGIMAGVSGYLRCQLNRPLHISDPTKQVQYIICFTVYIQSEHSIQYAPVYGVNTHLGPLHILDPTKQVNIFHMASPD